MPPEDLQLRDLVPSDPLLIEPGLPWWAWLLASLALAGLVTIVVWYRLSEGRRRTPPPVPTESTAYQAASRQLDEIASHPPAEIQPLATQTSAILRRYLTLVSGDPTLFETHEEYLARHDALKDYPEEVRRRTGETFSVLAGLKYDRNRSGEPGAVIDAARSLLEQLHQQSA